MILPNSAQIETAVTAIHELSSDLITSGGQQLLAASLVFLLVAPLAFLLRDRSPSLRLALWSLVLIRLLLPTQLTLPLPAVPVSEELDRIQVVAWEPYVQDREFLGPADETSIQESARPTVANSAYPPQEASPLQTSWKTALLGAWALGSLLTSLLLVRKRAQFRHLLEDSQSISEGPAFQHVEAWRKHLKVRRRVELKTSDQALAPFTLGTRHPIIFLPARLLEQQQDDLIYGVIGHEMAHVRRFDDLWLTLCRAIQCLYFFFPIAWICARKINDECEQLCDGLVLRAARQLEARSYANSLLAVMKLNLQGGQVTMAFGHSKHVVKNRLRHILEGRSQKNSGAHWSGLVFLLGLLALPLSGNVIAPPEPPAPDVPEVPAKPLVPEISLTLPSEPPSPPVSPTPLKNLNVPEVSVAPIPPDVPAPKATPLPPEVPSIELAPLAPLPPLTPEPASPGIAEPSGLVAPEPLPEPRVMAPSLAPSSAPISAPSPAFKPAVAPKPTPALQPTPAPSAKPLAQDVQPARAASAPNGTDQARATHSTFHQAAESEGPKPFLVVTHAGYSKDEITRMELHRIFLGKTKTKKKAKKISWIPVDQPTSSQVRQNFSQLILRKDATKVAEQWNRLEKKGRQRPAEQGNDQDVLAHIAENPGAIGYVSAMTSLPSGVKALKVSFQPTNSTPLQLPRSSRERDVEDRVEGSFGGGVR